MALRWLSNAATSCKLVSALSFGLQEETIKVRVIRLWNGMSYRTSDEAAIYFILLDEEDNQTLALSQLTGRARFVAELHEGLVYYITNFKIVAGPPKWNPVIAGKVILLHTQTKAWPCYDSCSIARMKFVLSTFPTIAARLEDMTALLADLSLDVSGVIYTVGNIKHNNHGVQKLSIQLMDDRGAVITISLWGFKATQFDMNFGIYRQKNLVLVVTGLLPKCNGGNIWLSSTSATTFYFNPAYKPLEKVGSIIASRYGEFICKLPSTEPYESLYPIGVQKIYLTLQQFKEPNTWVRPKLMHKQAFYCTVTIKYILSCEDWCFRPMRLDGVVCPPEKIYRCSYCRASFIPLSKSSKTIILAADTTGTAKLVIKTRELEKLAGLPLLQLITQCADKHVKHEIPLPQLKCIAGALCTFEIEVPTNAEAPNVSELIIKSIVESTKLVQKRKPDIYLAHHVGKKMHHIKQH